MHFGGPEVQEVCHRDRTLFIDEGREPDLGSTTGLIGSAALRSRGKQVGSAPGAPIALSGNLCRCRAFPSGTGTGDSRMLISAGRSLREPQRQGGAGHQGTGAASARGERRRHGQGRGVKGASRATSAGAGQKPQRSVEGDVGTGRAEASTERRGRRRHGQGRGVNGAPGAVRWWGGGRAMAGPRSGWDGGTTAWTGQGGRG